MLHQNLTLPVKVYQKANSL